MSIALPLDYWSHEKVGSQKFEIMPKRRNNWNYRGRGYYFVTLTTKNKIHWFGRIENAKPVLSVIGKIAEKNWLAMPDHFSGIVLEDYVIMPNHIHGILGIQETSTEIREIPTMVVTEKCLPSPPKKAHFLLP